MNKFLKISPILLILAFFIVLNFHSFPETQTFSRPNIIFIMADDLGYGDVGAYGQKKIETPHIDALARN
jgi:arylsulfatase